MLTYPAIDKVALQIGPIKIFWYGLMYAISFFVVWYLAKLRARKLKHPWQQTVIDDYIFYCALGVIIGGRLGYILFYDLSAMWHDPLVVFKIWQGGMSFHGGMLGVVASLVLFARKFKLSYAAVFDFSAPLAPIGLALGRIGNFINGELWGKVTNMPWGMVFPSGGLLPRHPSQLYEALAEGVLLGIILWLYTKKPRPRGAASAIFLLGYGIMRFCCEFWREPDAHLGFIIGNWLTMGQLLSLPMIVVGWCILLICGKIK